MSRVFYSDCDRRVPDLFRVIKSGTCSGPVAEYIRSYGVDRVDRFSVPEWAVYVQQALPREKGLYRITPRRLLQDVLDWDNRHLKLATVYKNPSTIRFMNNPEEIVQRTSVSRDHNVLRYIVNPLRTTTRDARLYKNIKLYAQK